ncbi:unnamed protein product [Onchocerca flexuosa]|uniref:CX domain-containing protein n=1 Tax=Onchocerca flexuosa TaxID=387005 RepID=A0A183HKY9_9BILA|nr:unnamed protein product [Onchocerca flexuosa]
MFLLKSICESYSGGVEKKIVIVIFLICGYFGYRKIKERRRSHGEYRPQFEEYQHAKNLPYLQPPSIEGLI